MKTMDSLSLPGRKEKSFIRSDYSTDTVYTFFRFREVQMTLAKREGTTTRLTDTLALEMEKDGLITQRQRQDYASAVCREYCHKDCHPEQSPEEMYAWICKTRRAIFGTDALQKAAEKAKDRGCAFDPTGGIDQREKKRQLLEKTASVIFVLTQPELFFLMEEDVAYARRAGKTVYICTDPKNPVKPQWFSQPEALRFVTARELPTEDSCLLFYGEEGFLYCRGLCVDAVVHGIPVGYHAQAMCNQLGNPKPCVVYVPRGLDITPWVPLSAQTRLSYWHLAHLCSTYGDGIYAMTPEQLYSRYPETFVNIYGNESGALPITPQGDDFAAFDRSKDEEVSRFLNSFQNLRYRCAYFSEALEEERIRYDSAQKQPGILVHSIRVKKALAADIIRCEKGVTPREKLAAMGMSGTGVVSNFLFFLTPKLGTLYNDLRADRPREQADAAAGHLDYMLCYRDGKRIETFPLFHKTCIAKAGDGSFLFFRFGLGGGSVDISGFPIRWEKEDVSAENPGAVCVYTPYHTVSHEDGDRETFRLAVGQGRVNIVILRDRVTCIRRGDVILPSVGVVLSLTEEAARPLLCRLKPLEDGYYDVRELTLSVRLDAPEGVDSEKWEQVRWAYGGGMRLISDGEGLCDGDSMLELLRRDGWMSPLSRQTQESMLHKQAKHPRTAIGTAENGDLVILVYSGRTWRSAGADYREMIEIARKLYPDIENLMNVDGGGSAMLGLVHEGSFLELSFPATSSGSCAGMVRPINTLFYIPAEKESTP